METLKTQLRGNEAFGVGADAAQPVSSGGKRRGPRRAWGRLREGTVAAPRGQSPLADLLPLPARRIRAGHCSNTHLGSPAQG